MDIRSTETFRDSLMACERTGRKGMFHYGLSYYPEKDIAEAAQDIYNRLTGHGLDFGAVVTILDIVQCQLRKEVYSMKL